MTCIDGDSIAFKDLLIELTLTPTLTPALTRTRTSSPSSPCALMRRTTRIA
jgi:hypothetical protein